MINKRGLISFFGLFILLLIINILYLIGTGKGYLSIYAYDCYTICKNECHPKPLKDYSCFGGSNHRCQCCAETNSHNWPGSCTSYYFSCSGTARNCHGGTGEHYRCVNGYHCTTSSTVHMGCCDCECGNPNTNHAPTCSISFPTYGGGTVFYDAKEYYDTNGTLTIQQPTARTGRINTSDADGDSVSVTAFSINRNCGALNRNGKNFTLTPQGHATGITPQLTGLTTCSVRLSATVSDGHANGTCTKDVVIHYYPTRLVRFNILDRNESSNFNSEIDDTNTIHTNTDFKYVGSDARDIASYTINVVNNSQPTRTLPPYYSRFNITNYLKGDAAPFSIRVLVYDLNGIYNSKLANSQIYLKEISSNNSGRRFRLLTVPSYTITPGNTYQIYTYGIKADGSIKNSYNTYSWDPCLNDGDTIICLRGRIVYNKGSYNYPIYSSLYYEVYPKSMMHGTAHTPIGRYRPYFGVVQDYEEIPWLKSSTSLHNLEVSLTDNVAKTYARDGSQWNIASFLYIDSLAPQVTSTQVNRINADTIELSVTITDDKPSYVPLSDWPGFASHPVYRTYFFAENEDAGKIPGVENRFLRDSNNHEIKAGDTINSNTYGWTLVSNNGNTRTYRLRVHGILGGDTLTYGFCVADNAGNARCCDSDHITPSCNLVPSTVLTYGSNWFKTSLGNLYSKGGFSGLPNYYLITNVNEYPWAAFVSPFNSTEHASISTFYDWMGISSSSIVRGYNGHYNNTPLGGVDFPQTGWSEYLLETAEAKCNLDPNCSVVTVTNGTDLLNALSNDYSKKVILVNSSTEIVLNEKVVAKGKKIVFLQNTALKLYEIYKPSGLVDYNNGVIFIATGHSSVTIDDDPTQDSTTGGGTVGANDSDLDIVQAGFIILDSSTFRVAQGLATHNRDQYQDSNGNFDRLAIQGFVYSQTLPILERDLGTNQNGGGANAKTNENYPSEWIIYDANLMNLFDDMLGRRKIQTFNCNVVRHPLCNE